MTTKKMAFGLVLLMAVSVLLPQVLAGDSSDNTISNTSCNTYADPPNNTILLLAGSCDDWDPTDDFTPNNQEWLLGDYDIKLLNATSIELVMEWRIHEYARSTVAGVDFNIDPDTPDDQETMGIPVDYLRNYFDLDADGPGGESDTVKQVLIEGARQNVEQLAESFGTSHGAISYYIPSTTAGGDGVTSISCTDTPDTDSFDEGAAVEDAYNPPLCIKSEVTIDLDQSKLNFAGGADTSQENTLRGLLKMGTTIKMPFSIFAPAGHRSQFTIHPPSYGNMVETGADGCASPVDTECNGAVVTHVNSDGSSYQKGRWIIDNTAAMDGAPDATRDIWYKLRSNDAVVIDTENDKSLGIDITLNLADESAADLTIDLYVNYISEQTMTDWNFTFMDNSDFAETPWITADGIRLVHHNGIADLSNVTSAFPIESITDAFEGVIGAEIESGPLEWRNNAENTAGLDLVHTSGTCAAVGVGVHRHYCLAGQYAMDDTFPVLMRSESEPFAFKLMDLMTQQMDSEALPINLSELSSDDLETILNSGLELGIDLGEEYMQQMIPEGLPPTEVEFNIVLPSWVDTDDGTGVISLTSKLDGTGNSAIRLVGNNPWDWQHVINDPETGEQVCKATEKTCMAAKIDLDFSGLDVDEWSKAIRLTLGGEVLIDIYRIGLADSMMQPDESGNEISIDAIPSDLLRQIAFLDTQEPIFSDEIDLFGQTVQFELTNAGLHKFAQDLGDGLTNEIHSNSIADSNFDLDLSGVFITVELQNLYAPDAGQVNDVKPLRLRLALEETTVIASYSESGVAVNTERVGSGLFASSIFQITHAITSGVAAMAPGVSTSGDGIQINNNGESFTADITGPDMDLGTLGSVPKLSVSVSLPPGLSLGDFSSNSGLSTVDEVDGRQIIQYSVPQAGQTDQLSFSIIIGWSWILAQIGVYLGGIVLAMVLLFVWRKHKVGKKSKKLENEFESAARKALDRGQMGAMAGYGGMEEFGVPNQGGEVDDDLARFIY